MTRSSTLTSFGRPQAARLLDRIPAPCGGAQLGRSAPWPILASWCGPSYAIDIVAIEEHWEVEVGEPDAESSGPQVCMVMSPTGTLDGDYFVFTINHHSDPEYVPGGMQVQQWCGEDVIDSKESSTGTLHHDDEVVRWVQRTELNGGALTF